MKKIFAIWLMAAAAANAGTPEGTVVELHACELYTGGCTAAAEVTLAGRSLLRVWTIAAGSFNGVALDGKQVAAIETGEDNLAANRDLATRAVIYLPQGLPAAEREALLGWVRTEGLGAKAQIAKVEETPLWCTVDGDRVAVAIGDKASLKTDAVPPCGTGSCGEQMWYTPRSAHTGFRALLNVASQIQEPALSLAWKAHGMRSVFVAEFGKQPAVLAAHH